MGRPPIKRPLTPVQLAVKRAAAQLTPDQQAEDARVAEILAKADKNRGGVFVTGPVHSTVFDKSRSAGRG